MSPLMGFNLDGLAKDLRKIFDSLVIGIVACDFQSIMLLNKRLRKYMLFGNA